MVFNDEYDRMIEAKTPANYGGDTEFQFPGNSQSNLMQQQQQAALMQREIPVLDTQGNIIATVSADEYASIMEGPSTSAATSQTLLFAEDL